jgi:rubrerythrin
MTDFQTLQDVIDFAIALEQASQKFYERLAHQTSSRSVQHFLLEMVTEEKVHETQLRAMIANGGDILSSEISSRDMDHYIDAMNIPDPLDYKQAIKIARDKENASHMLYTILAGLVKETELHSMLELLARQEKNHHDFFVRQYRRICVQEN